MNALAMFIKRYSHFELIENQLYFTVTDDQLDQSNDSEVLFSIEDYPTEFAVSHNCPPSLKQIHIFIGMFNKIIGLRKTIHFYTKIANLPHSLTLLGCFMMIRMKQTADLTFAPFSLLSALIKPFQGVDDHIQQKTYDLTVVTCLRSFEKAIKNKWFHYDTFNVQKYDYFKEQDMSWIIPNYLLSFFSNTTQSPSANKAFLAFHKLRINHLISINDSPFDIDTINNYGFDFNQISIKSIVPSAQATKQFFTLLSNSNHTFAVHSHSSTDLSYVTFL